MEEIGKHNFKGDCWIIIDKKVYDVSNFTTHPAKFDVFSDIRYAGKDCTDTFKIIHFNNKTVNILMKKFFIGRVKY